jgi:EAL domain-containing protein (putative c-di-GMP-specific phosphodiesterase class I)
MAAHLIKFIRSDEGIPARLSFLIVKYGTLDLTEFNRSTRMGIWTEKGKEELARIQEATDYPVQRSKDGWIVGDFYNCWLSSVFQPVFDGSGREIAGHAAYIRSESPGKSPMSPWSIFALTEGDALLVYFDRLCRTIHALNYFSNGFPEGNLFVSVQPRLLESVKDDHGRAFERILNLIEVKTSRVIIEIPIEVNRDWKLLRHVIGNYRSRGYQIAVNHSGATEDWMAELASLYPLSPNIIRLEAPFLLRHEAGSLADAIHHFGATLQVREIETAQQMAAAIRAGADFLQGRFLGEPARAIESAGPHMPKADNRRDMHEQGSVPLSQQEFEIEHVQAT